MTRPARVASRPACSDPRVAEPQLPAARATAPGGDIPRVPAPRAKAAPSRLLIATGGTVLAGILYSAACPLREWWPLAWAVPGVLLGSTRDLRARNAFLHGALFAVVIGYGIAGWTYHAALEYFAFHRLLCAAFVGSVWLVYGGIPYGLLLVAHGRLRRRVPVWAEPVLGAWLWVAAELVRSRLFTGLPWELLGHTQFRNLTLVQIADLGGVPAVSFVLAFVSVAGANLIVAVRRGSVRLAPLALPAGLLAATLAYGTYARRAYGTPPAGATVHTLAVVQGNIPNEFHWKRAFFERTLATYARLSASGSGEAPDLIVWPENAANFYLDREPLLLAQLSAVAARARDGLLLGGPRLADDGAARNSAYLIGASGTIRAVYDKRRLVPFAEYDPFRSVHAGPPDGPVYTAGSEAWPLQTPGLSVGTVVCYEVLFPHLVRDLVRNGADVLVNISNDAWLDAGDDTARRQHFSMAVFRAIETRRFLVRAAATGVSGFVSPTGEAYAMLAAGTAGAATGAVVPRHDQTPYVRWGDRWVLVAGLALVVVAARGRWRALA